MADHRRRFRLDPDRSVIGIHASSSVHPIDTEAPVSGWIDLVDAGGDGWRPVDGASGPSGEIEFDLGGMRSGNPLVDREAERRLDVRRHPTVVGRLTSLVETAEAGSFDGAGELDFHGVTRPIIGSITITAGEGDDEVVLEGSTEIDVTDFDVQPPSLLVVKVHADVRIDLHAVAVPDS